VAIQFFLFIYAVTTMFVLLTMQRNRRMRRPTLPIVTMAGWGLFSLSSTLAILMGAVALALAMGLQMPLPAAFSTAIF
jgi:sterol desaturase/sphingolipid hydroxylase (fatty acid hydroxylase superfamily)